MKNVSRKCSNLKSSFRLSLAFTLHRVQFLHDQSNLIHECSVAHLVLFYFHLRFSRAFNYTVSNVPHTSLSVWITSNFSVQAELGYSPSCLTSRSQLSLVAWFIDSLYSPLPNLLVSAELFLLVDFIKCVG